MDEIKKILASAKDFWKKQSKKQKIIYFSVLGGLVTLAVILAIVLNTDTYATIAQGLDGAQSSEVVALLRDSGIEVKVENGGIIKIPKAAEPEALMQLSIAGYPSGSVNYDIFKSNVGFTSTEFEKNQYLRFQTEANIANSIRTIPHVRDASVNIAMADSNQYVLSTERIETKASVKVNMYTGFDLSPSQVKGIEALIANSVPGLTAENVSVLDSNGKLLNGAGAQDDSSSENKLKLSYERMIEDSIKEKVLDILTGPFNREGISVAVTAVLDYNKMISEEMSYIPSVDDRGIVSHEESSESTQTATTDDGVTGVENNAEVPTYPETQGGGSNSESSSNARSVDYLVSYIKTQREKDGAERKAVTVSVMVNREMMTDTERESFINAVSMAAGVEASNVSFVNLRFAEPADIVSEELNLNMIMLVGGSALALILLVVLIVSLIARSRRRKRENEQLALAAAGVGQGDLAQHFGTGIPGMQPPKPDLGIAKLEVSETKEMALKREIQSFSKENPDIAAQLLRTWLKGEDEDGYY